MAHSLIPIVAGYVVAHYLSYLVERGQQTVIALFGLHGVEVNYLLSTRPSLLATLKMCFVPAGHQITGQLMMMLTMVAYTFAGLYLLFGG